MSAAVGSGFAVDDKAAAAGGDIGEFDCCCICGTKDDIGVACPITEETTFRCSNDQIGESIAVDITSRADGRAAVMVIGFPMDDWSG